MGSWGPWGYKESTGVTKTQLRGRACVHNGLERLSFVLKRPLFYSCIGRNSLENTIYIIFICIYAKRERKRFILRS